MRRIQKGSFVKKTILWQREHWVKDKMNGRGCWDVRNVRVYASRSMEGDYDRREEY